MNEYNPVSIENLSFYYDQSLLEDASYPAGEKTVSLTDKANQLKHVSLKVMPGEVVLLTGASGCGKTSIVRFINGLIPHFFGGYYEGRVELFSQNINTLKVWEYGREVGSVFQNPKSQFFANKTIDELAFASENYGIESGEIIRKREDIIRHCQLEHLRNKDVHQLSSGEKQKLAFASAMMLSPRLYVLDEPSANLDMASSYRLRDSIKTMKDSGSSFLIAEHRLYYLLDVVDRVYFMQNGKIMGEFSAPEFRALDEETADSMGLRRRFTGFPEVSAGRAAALERPVRKEHTRPGQPASKTQAPAADKAPASARVLMELQNVSFRFRKQKEALLKDISLKIHSGEVVALTGPNGAGKTTLASLLCGLRKERQGRVLFQGAAVPRQRRQKHVWFVMQETGCQLFAESVFDEMLIGIKKTEANKAKARRLLEDLMLLGRAEEHPAALSGGEAQRLTFAVALMQDTEIVVFDEPTSGLDGANLKRVESFIHTLQLQGRAVILITHDHELIAQSCSRIVYLKDGLIQSDSPLNEKSYNKLLEKVK